MFIHIIVECECFMFFKAYECKTRHAFTFSGLFLTFHYEKIFMLIIYLMQEKIETKIHMMPWEIVTLHLYYFSNK